MIQLVDSHCHLHMLDLAEFNNDVAQVVQNAREQGLSHMLCVGTTLEDNTKILAIAQRFDDVSASVGLHPNESANEEPTVEMLVNLAQHAKVIAIGETGLDYYRTEAKQPWQQNRFRTHIQAAIAAGKPLIIHSRAARQDTLNILREENAESIGGVFHCFTEDWDTAKQALDLNFYVSFSGIVTFKNATELQEVAKKLPLDKMLIETDAPYLAPMPHRGKMNQPAYVRLVAEFLANLRGIALEDLAQQTTANFHRLFDGVRSKKFTTLFFLPFFYSSFTIILLIISHIIC